MERAATAPPASSSPEDDDGRALLRTSGMATSASGLELDSMAGPRRVKPLVVVALVIVQLSFAVSGVLCGSAMHDSRVDPVVFAFLRDTLGAVVLLTFAAYTSPNGLVMPRVADVPALMGVGILGIYFGQLFLLLALKHVSVVNASVLSALQPACTMLLGHLLGVELLHLENLGGEMRAVGLLFAVAGGLAIVVGQWSSGTHTPLDNVIGNTYLFFFCLGGACFPLLQKHLLISTDMSATAVAGWGTTFGAATIGLTVPVSRAELDYWRLPGSALVALAYVVLITSAFNYGALAWCNSQSSPVFVSAFYPLQLVFTSALAMTFLGESFGWREAIGALGVCAGLSLVTASRMSAFATASTLREALPARWRKLPEPEGEGASQATPKPPERDGGGA